MYENVNYQKILITPDIAARLLQQNTRNVPLKESLVNYYAEIMKRGEWQLNSDSICVSETGVLLNGQHRLNAVVKSGIPCWFFIATHMSDSCQLNIDIGQHRKNSAFFSLNGIPNASVIASAVNIYIGLIYQMSNPFTHGLEGAKKLTPKQSIDIYNQNTEIWHKAYYAYKSIPNRSNIISPSNFVGLFVYLANHLNYPESKVSYFLTGINTLSSSDNSTIETARLFFLRNKNMGLRMRAVQMVKELSYAWCLYIKGKHITKFHIPKDYKISF